MENIPSQETNFIDPEEVLNQINLQLGSTVADFGCGSGYFVFPIAKRLKEDGKVYALDVLKDKLEAIESQAKLSGLTNIITKRVNLEKEGGSKLEDESLDWVVIKDMLFQNQNKEVILAEAKRVLKPEGRMIVIEWGEENGSVGPEGGLRVAREKLTEMLSGAGLKIVQEISAGNFHYGLIASKQL